MLFDDCLIFFVLRSGICLLNMLFVAFLAVHSFSMISPYAFLATFPVCACFVLPRFSLLSTLLLFGFPCCSCFLVLVLLFTAFGLGLADPCGSLRIPLRILAAKHGLPSGRFLLAMCLSPRQDALIEGLLARCQRLEAAASLRSLRDRANTMPQDRRVCLGRLSVGSARATRVCRSFPRSTRRRTQVMHTLFSCIAFAALSVPVVGDGRGALERFPPEVSHVASFVDNFDFTNNATFQQKVLTYKEWWKTGNPILFFFGGEGSVGTFYNASGAVFEHAQALGAFVVFLEHRYYGESLPGSSLRGLTVEQALADTTWFLGGLRSRLGCSEHECLTQPARILSKLLDFQV